MEAYHKNGTKVKIIYESRKVYDWLCWSVFREPRGHGYELSLLSRSIFK